MSSIAPGAAAASASRRRLAILRPRYVLPLATVLLLVLATTASGLIGRATAEEDTYEMDGVTVTADRDSPDDSSSGPNSRGNPSQSAVTAANNAAKAQTAAAEAALLSGWTSQLFGFSMGKASIAGRAAAAKDHADKASQAARSGDVQGSYAELAAALAELEGAARELAGIAEIAVRDGDPNGLTARDGASQALTAVQELA